MVFVLSMGAAVALLASLWPAVAHSRVRLAANGAARFVGSTTGRHSSALLQSLQVALALILAIGSGLLARSLQAAVTTDVGFDPKRLYALTVILPNDGYLQSGAKEVAADALVDALMRLEPATHVPIILRSGTDASQLRNSVEATVRSVDPAAQTFERADAYQRPLFMAALVSLFARGTAASNRFSTA